MKQPTPSPIDDPQLELFRTELASIIDLKHPLAKLAHIVDWAELEKVFGESYCDDNGRAATATRLMVALHYLKFTYDLSDEAGCDRLDGKPILAVSVWNEILSAYNAD